MNPACALCSLDLPVNAISDGNLSFCCAGCHAVFMILKHKNAIDDYQDNPIFLQAVKSGLISNPHLIDKIRQKRLEVGEHELERIYFEIQEMWCPSCAEVISLFLLQEKGIKNCVVDYATDLASVEFAPRFISKEKIYSLIGSLGYLPAPASGMESKAVSFSLYLRFVIAAFCSLNVMMFAYPIYAAYFDFDTQNYGSLLAWISLVFTLPVLTYCSWPILKRFWSALKVGLLGMEALVVIGIGASFALSFYELIRGGTKIYFDSLTVIVVFVLLGKIIEAKAKFSAKETLLRLTRSLPRRGRKRLATGEESFVLAKEFQPGDLLVVYAGEKIILDGVVVEGEGGCDESLMTGEVVPVHKAADSKVIGGTILSQGHLLVKVTHSIEDSALQRIINMIERDIGGKNSYVRAADKVVRWFVPLVIILALLTGIFCVFFGNSETEQQALLRAVAVLLISCPCALGIAAPLAESHVMNGMAKLGAIIRNRGCLSLIGKETLFVCDKTGTMTEGRFTVLQGLENLTPLERAQLKGLISKSNHPMSVAIAHAIEEQATSFEKQQEIVGKGVRGLLNNQWYYLGSKAFLIENGIVVSENNHVDQEGVVSQVFFGQKDRLITSLLLGDKVRTSAETLMTELRDCKKILLSGDGKAAVESVAKQLHFDYWLWGMTPLQKREYIDQKRNSGELVCMLGDGINDAPALTGAHIGISVVNATDLSIQVSDILLTTDRLYVISWIRKFAKKGRRIIKQNLFWAFFYNILGIPLAMFGLLSPIFAAFAMVASSLIVLFNARRIK